LQQEFNQHVFKLEQEEYIREEINWSFIDFNDNQPCIELIEGKLGILALLDEESRLPSGSDKSLIDKLYSNFEKKHNYFGKPRFGQQAFIVRHFAHDVEYDISGFIDKNKDTVPDEMLSVFEASSFPFLVEVASAHKVAKPSEGAVTSTRKVAVKHTLGSVFKLSLVQLMETINSTNVSYIRCIKSNSEKKPFLFDPQMVLSQLRACGVLETIRISTAGYPGRWRFDEFVDRYYLLLSSQNWFGGIKDIRQMCLKLLQFALPEQDKYQIGKSKIFFRAGQLAYLERLRAERLHYFVVLIQKIVRGRKARKEYLLLKRGVIKIQARYRGIRARTVVRGMREGKAAICIQCAWKGFSARKRYSRIQNAVLKIQRAWKGVKLRRVLAARHSTRAATKIQSTWRMHQQRSAYRLSRKRVILIQCCIRRHKAKRELTQLRIEARSVNHLKEISYKLENKVVELTQALGDRERAARQAVDQVKTLEVQIKSLREKYDAAVAQLKSTQSQLTDASSSSREIEAYQAQQKGLTSQLNAANDVIKSKDNDISALQEQIHKLKEDASRRTKSSTVSSPRTPMGAQDALIVESTQINALKMELEAVRKQLEVERQKSAQVAASSQVRSHSGDTVPPEFMWQNALRNPGSLTGSKFLNVQGLSNIQTNRIAATVLASGVRQTQEELRRLRRHSSAEIWSEAQKSLVELTSPLGGFTASRSLVPGRQTPPRNEEEEIMEQEHTFSLLQDEKLEEEILEALVRSLDIPKVNGQEATRRQIVFPAHVVGLFAIKMWQHGMSSKMSQFLKNVVQAIEDRTVHSNFDDEEVVFWLTNLMELDSVLQSAVAPLSGSGGSSSTSGRTPIFMEGERILVQTRSSMDALFRHLLFQWLRVVKKRVSKFIIPCVIENQSLPGFVTKDSSSLFKKFVSTQSYTIEQLLECVSHVWKVLKFYTVDDSVVRQCLSEVFKMIGVTSFNHLIMRKNFATWKRGMQIQYNVSRLTEWCAQHSLSEAALHLERLMQAAKLLQLNKATPANIELYIEDLFDVCFLLSPTQISKLMAIYTVADFENPISPDILKAVASRSVSSDTVDVLLLEATPDNDMSWYARPESRKLLGVEKYLPPLLEQALPRIILLFKFS
jgi:myosin-5